MTETDKEFIEKLLRMIKREVKQIMEEAVTRKFVHEDSSSITSLCAAVDACLSHGLKRRALGLFKTNSTTALLQKVAKDCDAAEIVLKKVVEIENSDPNKRSSSSSDSLNRTRMSFKIKSASATNNNSGTTNNNSGTITPPKYRFLWIRIALFEKLLVNIVDHVVENSSKYYERDALVADPVAGQILASLLVGPCALDYTKMKPQDQFWSDPPADELVQRHRISSSIASPTSLTNQNHSQSTPPSARKLLGMGYKRLGILNGGIGDSEEQVTSGSPGLRSATSICWSPRDYVESLHQNAKSTLLYGKNNVVMQPKDDMEPMPGYLSLHQDANGLIIKWTPNQLINGRINQSSENNGSDHPLDKTNIFFWNHALNVNVENIVYLHCHQQPQSCGSIVMVGRDGVMHPPIKFPKGGHLLAFLSCLENGLVPFGQLDPPLWSEQGKGKILPKLRRKGPRDPASSDESTNTEDTEDIAADYVFRVISICDKPDSISPELMELQINHESTEKSAEPPPKQPEKIATTSQSNSSCLPSADFQELNDNMTNEEKEPIQVLCDTMKKQIISRAFYGWLAYCRHLKTVRTHLADLVNPTIHLPDYPTDATKGITAELWNQIQSDDGRLTIDLIEFNRLIYYGGIEHSIRSQAWLYLLEHYRFEDTKEDKRQHDLEMRQKYEMVMSEWLAVEAIVRQRDKEIVAANLAKLSSESTNNDSAEMNSSLEKFYKQGKFITATNEVFEDEMKCDNNDADDSFTPVTGSRRSSANDKQKSEQIDPNETNSSWFHSQARKPLIRHNKVESVPSQTSITGPLQGIFITNPSIDRNNLHMSLETSMDTTEPGRGDEQGPEENSSATRLPVNSMESGGSQCVSPASSNGGLYSNELLDLFSLNLHRIDKDVQRCDRNFWYFTKENLEKLRNVMCTYVWEHLDIGYVQGMCDLVAPLLVIFDDEVFTYSCFCQLMKRMASNFPHGGAMDTHFANMRSLIQILDADIFELMHKNGDYTHFYFCYRWFLLDFKRELIYADVFSVWETIWAAKHVSSSSFVLFIALALVEYYRDIILENNMDFTDIIKFFNEMAERHDVKAVLAIARDLVHQIQTLMENK